MLYELKERLGCSPAYSPPDATATPPLPRGTYFMSNATSIMGWLKASTTIQAMCSSEGGVPGDIRTADQYDYVLKNIIPCECRGNYYPISSLIKYLIMEFLGDCIFTLFKMLVSKLIY